MTRIASEGIVSLGVALCVCLYVRRVVYITYKCTKLQFIHVLTAKCSY